MTTFLEIAVNVPQVTGVFHYHLPHELEGSLDVGHLVVVPFGKQTVQGVVLRFIEHPEVAKTRPVIDLVDPDAVLTYEQLELARYMSNEYLAPLASCIGLMLPAGLMQQSDVLYSLQAEEADDLTDTQARLWSLLKRRGSLRGAQIDHGLRYVNWRASVRSLVRRGLVTTQSVLPPPKVRPKLVRTAQLACPPETALESLPDLGRHGTKALARRGAMLRFLIREPGPVDVTWVYAESGGNLADLRYLNERGLVLLGESEIWRDPLGQVEVLPDEAPALTKDQRSVWLEVQRILRESQAGGGVQPVLIHGVTGSGKTEIYLTAVQEVLGMGKQAIILVPEISLTPQTVHRFVSRFPGRVGLIHSGLSPGERYDTWRRARSGALSVVVGPRSALFVPFSRLGIIVVDESHDDSYYQSEPQPHYHARQVGVAYAHLCGAVCLLGSATPDVTSIYRCQRKEWRYLKLPSRILAHRKVVQSQISRTGATEPRFRPLEAQADAADLPPVTVVDMRAELQAGNRSIFSRALQVSLERTLDQHQQAILFLNRRGTATYIFCRDCGHTLKCPRCDLPLTYHNARNELLCHYCGYQRNLPDVCPACGSRRIRHYGTGTQRVESELQKLFPQARTIRWDHETTRKKGAHQIILSHFAAHRADVLVGTQMLAKGLDLPFVTLVGVVLADVGLSLPDYRANERTFQVLTQVAGRAGRSPLGGEVVLQTFQPEHYVIQAASGHAYKAFFQQELKYRQKLAYPPYTRLVRLEYRNTDRTRVQETTQKMAARIKNWLVSGERRATRMIGPVPCFFERLAGVYRWQIVLSGPDPASLLRDRPLGDWKVEVDPINLL